MTSRGALSWTALVCWQGTYMAIRGVRCCCFSSDLEYACNELGLRHFNGTWRGNCCLCNANTNDIPFNDFRADALWRALSLQRVSTCGVSARRNPPLVQHPWFSMYTFLSMRLAFGFALSADGTARVFREMGDKV